MGDRRRARRLGIVIEGCARQHGMANTHIERKRAGFVATLLAAILALPSTAGPTQHEPPKGAQQRLASFLRAFENLDMDPFIACFAVSVSS